MTQRKPGDYVVNVELTDEQRELFVADCVAAGAEDAGDVWDPDYEITAMSGYMVEGVDEFFPDNPSARDVTHEYKGKTMTAQSELMRQIADAMERNPEGWPQEFQRHIKNDHWITCDTEQGALIAFSNRELRPKPRTYTLRIEDMPEPLRKEPGEDERYWYASPKSGKVGCHVWLNDKVDRACFNNGLCYPDETTARQALEKLTRAMGGGE